MPIILLPARYKACKEGTEEVSDKIDWTKAWNRKYPILDRYRGEVDSAPYVQALEELLGDLEKKYGYNELDSFLVLKDILAEVWKVRKQSGRTIQ